MIGSGLRKFANENGLKVDHGVAYGFLRGYATTFSDGSGIKTMYIATRFADAPTRYAFMEKIQSMGMEKSYMLQALDVQDKLITVVFADTIGTMKRIAAFVEAFYPILEEHGASRSDICPECGMMLTDGRWKLVNGIAIYIHEGCGERIRETIDAGNQERLSKGNYFTGAVGALLGSVLGSALWAVLAVVGYIFSIVGFVIGFLAEKGYSLLGGKKGWGKVVILILAVLLGVVLGNFISVVYVLFTGYEFASLGECISATFELCVYEPEVRSAMISDCIMGFLFAVLGVIVLLKKTGKEVSGAKYVDLD